ncbi:MAG TPA: hypothetical protein PLU27_08590, partial [Ginsengibacter sp.]|nr:hypothetical protein [Ginsengibacter sp.]
MFYLKSSFNKSYLLGAALLLSTAGISQNINSGNMQVASGINTSFFINAQNQLYTWGNNSRYQWPKTKSSLQYLPVKVMDNVSRVTSGEYHILILKTDGSLWAIGNNDYGQLGDGSTNNRSTAVQIST